MAGRNPYIDTKPKIPHRLLQFDDLYRAVQELLFGYESTKDMMIMLPHERTDVIGRTLPAPEPRGIWAWNEDASAPRYYTPEQFYAEMPVSLHLDQLVALEASARSHKEDAQTAAGAASNSAGMAAASASEAVGHVAAAATQVSLAQGHKDGAIAAATDADESAVRAAASAVAASNTAADVTTLYGQTVTQKNAAQTAASQAQQWAAAAPNVVVGGGLYSARHYAQLAANTMTGALTYQGVWDPASAAYPASPALGHLYRVSASGTFNGIEYSAGDQIIFNGSTWDHVDNSDAVTSVNGMKGDVVIPAASGALANKDQADWDTDLINIPAEFTPKSHTHTKGDVGLSNVDNTSDMDKPVSTAQVAALALKADASATVSLTSNQTISGQKTFTNQVRVNIPGDSWAFHAEGYGGLWADANGTQLVAYAGERWDYLTLGTDGHAHVKHGRLSVAGEPVGDLTVGTNYVYPTGSGLGVRVGDSSYRYFTFGNDGAFSALSGGIFANGAITTNNLVGFRINDSAGTTIQGQMRHNGTNLYVSSDVGDLILRPGGYGSSVGQLQLNTGGAYLTTGMTITGGVNTPYLNGTSNNTVRLGYGNAGITHSFISWHTAADTTTRTAYVGFGSAGTDVFYINNERGGVNVMQGSELHIRDVHGAGIALLPNGEIMRGNANNRGVHVRQPRIFVQSADPGAAAIDGDLWVW